MGEKSKIEWTDHTFNHCWGCAKVHAGCKNCYAEAWARRWGVGWGLGGPRACVSEKIWANPIRWNERAKRRGVRERVFCASMADVFENWGGQVTQTRRIAPKVFVQDEGWIDRDGQFRFFSSPADKGVLESQGMRPLRLDDLRKRLFELIDATPYLDWQILTKRPENIQEKWVSRVELQTDLNEVEFRRNVWLGTSISDQESHDRQIDAISGVGNLTPLRFLSIEPLLEPIKLDLVEIEWVIVGGESGPRARPYIVEHAADIIRQCLRANVPVFHKQLGSFPVTTNINQFEYDGNSAAWGDYAAGARFRLSHPKGADMGEWPVIEDSDITLDVREFPEVRL